MEHLIPVAEALARSAHKDQMYGELPYFEGYIQNVVRSLELYKAQPIHIVVAFLQDIVEDTFITLKTIRNIFGEEVAEAVDAMTFRGDDVESEKEFLLRCRNNKVAHFTHLHCSFFHLNKKFKWGFLD